MAAFEDFCSLEHVCFLYCFLYCNCNFFAIEMDVVLLIISIGFLDLRLGCGEIEHRGGEHRGRGGTSGGVGVGRRGWRGGRGWGGSCGGGGGDGGTRRGAGGTSIICPPLSNHALMFGTHQSGPASRMWFTRSCTNRPNLTPKIVERHF